MTTLQEVADQPAAEPAPFAGEYLRVIALALLPILLFTAAVVFALTGHEREKVLARLQASSAAAADTVDGFVAQQLAVLDTLAGSHTLDQGDLAGFYLEAERARASRPDWLTIILLDRSGNQLLNLLRPLGTALPPYPDPETHRRVVEGGKPVVVARPRARGAITGKPVFGVRYPVLRDGRAKYVVTAGLEPRLLTDALDHLALPAGWGAAIFDETGLILACTSCPEDSVGELAQPAALERILGRRTEIGFVTSRSGVDSYFALARAPVSGWMVGVRVPRADATKLWLSQIWVIAAAGLASVLTALGALAWLTQRRRRTHNFLEVRIQERTQALNRTLSERNLLLRELYHRVKNNLQQVDTLIRFQARRSADAEQKAALETLRNRVHSLALVHQQLMRSNDLSTMDIHVFLGELTSNLAIAADIDDRAIRLRTDVTPQRVSIDYAMPIGLLVTELVTNCFKHAFPDGRAGNVTVRYRPDAEGGHLLTVADDGIPGDKAPSGLGWTLIEALVAQLDASVTVERSAGTVVAVTIPEPRD